MGSNFLRGVHAGAIPTLRVSAAASLADALKEMHGVYEKKVGGRIELNFGTSSLLARQIEEDAPVDVIISADLAKMEALQKMDLITAATKENQPSNAPCRRSAS